MFRNILKSSTLYAAGTMARTATSIIMLPIYTRYLSPSVYGTAELLNIILDLTVLLLGARITTGMFKFYADAENQKEKHTVLSTCLWLGLLFNIVAMMILWGASPLIALALGDPSITEALRWIMFTLAFATIGEIGMGYFRVNDQAGRYLLISLLRLASQIAASLYFIVYKEAGLWGVIYSALIGAGFQALLLLTVIISTIGLRFSTTIAKNLIIFSMPIIISSIAMYYMTFGDRYFLQIFHDTSSVGIYALGYKFGFMLLALVWGPFMSYWGAKQFDHARSPGGAEFFSQAFSIATYILWAGATGMLIFVAPAIQFMADASYHSAAHLVPPIVLAYVFHGWAQFHQFGILDSKNTRFLNTYTWISAAVMSIFYILLIPPYGGMGAAIATLVGMVLRFVLIYRKSQQYFKFITDWKKIFFLFSGSYVAYASTIFLYNNDRSDFVIGILLYFFIIITSVLTNCAPLTRREISKQTKAFLSKDPRISKNNY